MDISTGHMVLVTTLKRMIFAPETNHCNNAVFQAYMEDHLNNKNRLDREWAALCAYEAEPCAVNVARKVSKRRSDNILIGMSQLQMLIHKKTYNMH